MEITGDYYRDLLEIFALEWEADIRFNKMSDGSEPGPEVKICPCEQCDRETTERRIAFIREVAEQMKRLREALSEIAADKELHTNLNQERLCRKFQHIAEVALNSYPSEEASSYVAAMENLTGLSEREFENAAIRRTNH